MTRLLILMIKAYQYFISPMFPPSCRFTPSCSEYCKDALVKYGFLRGIWFSLKRIIRCNPWNSGGYDPVP